MATQTHLIYEFDDFHLETDQRKLMRRGELIPLHGKAFEMLVVLIRNSGRLLTKDELFQLVWPDQIVEESNLTVNMSAIRRALGERASNPRYITTVSGLGYRFTADVRQFAAETLTIERETFARLTVQEEETERAGVMPSSAQIVNAIQRVTSRPVLLCVMCSVVLALAGIGLWVRGHRKSAGPLPWTNVRLSRFVTQGGVPFRVAISPDGKSLVYRQRINGQDSLWLGQIEANSSVMISDEPNVTYYTLAFSPDGQSIYATARDRRQKQTKLVRMPVLGGIASELTSNIDSTVTFSPDGSKIAFIFNNHESKQSTIEIADAIDCKNEHTLSALNAPQAFSSAGLSWSPDGKLIGVGANTGDHGQTEIVTVRVSDGAIEKLTNRAWDVVGQLAWLPDQSGLVLAVMENSSSRRGEIWFVSYPQNEAHKISGGVDIYQLNSLGMSTNGTVTVLRGHLTSEIRIAPNGDISKSRTVYPGVEPGYEGVDGLAWGPEGHLFFSAYVGDSQPIWQVNVDGTQARQLTNNPDRTFDRHMKVTRDGRYIVFQSDRSGTLQIWRANSDGTNLKQLTTGGNNYWPSLSPDGQSVIYNCDRSDISTICRVPIDGGDVIQLASGPASRPTMSPDGKYIAFFEPAKSALVQLAVMLSSGGEPVKTFDLPNTMYATEIAWTPDCKALLYKDGFTGVWRQQLDKQIPRREPGLADKEVYQLAWSPDGKNLAYSTGARMQEIILLQQDSR
jgi:Tol biopolymer transport system component/DNA-binding winged helix-turn-helix (wHTH) protein